MKLARACATFWLLGLGCTEPDIRARSEGPGSPDAGAAEADAGPDEQVECRSSADCGDFFCSPAGRCVQCLDDAYCRTFSSTILPYCSADGRCVACVDEKCDGVCNATSGCGYCADKRDCPEGFDCLFGFCEIELIDCEDSLDCPGSTHCGGSYCDECLEDAHCPDDRPHCSSAGACVACRGDHDCPPQLNCGPLVHRCQ
jgi:hypothetical protein